MAKKAGYSAPYLSLVENDIAVPTVGFLVKVAKVLNVQVWFIVAMAEFFAKEEQRLNGILSQIFNSKQLVKFAAN